MALHKENMILICMILLCTIENIYAPVGMIIRQESCEESIQHSKIFVECKEDISCVQRQARIYESDSILFKQLNSVTQRYIRYVSNTIKIKTSIMIWNQWCEVVSSRCMETIRVNGFLIDTYLDYDHRKKFNQNGNISNMVLNKNVEYANQLNDMHFTNYADAFARDYRRHLLSSPRITFQVEQFCIDDCARYLEYVGYTDLSLTSKNNFILGDLKYVVGCVITFTNAKKTYPKYYLEEEKLEEWCKHYCI